MNLERANRLAALRKEKGLSQEELAERIGVSRQAISKWENGESSPDTDNLIALAELYGITLDELVGEKKPEPEPEPEVEVVDAPGEDVVMLNNQEDIPEVHKRMRVSGLISSVGMLIALIAYMIVGFTWKGPEGSNLGWAAGWILFLVPIVISSLVRAFENRRFTAFSGGWSVLTVAVYCGLGIIGNAYGQNFWHPEWVMFFGIPVYSTIAGFIDNRRLHNRGRGV